MWTKEMFGTGKPIIALLHLDSLPGDPDFCGSLDTVIEHASVDLQALQDGGVDAVLIANEFSSPLTDVTHTETIMAMACVIGAIKKDIRIPFGTNVVMNPQETIKMAAATGASFGRSAFAGAYAGSYGVHSVNWGESVRLKYAVGRPDLKLLCKVNPEGDVRLANQSIESFVGSICQGGHVGALCVSGPGPGQETSWDLLMKVSEFASPANVPVFCNTGCRQDTIEKILTIADGGCVGTTFKASDGRIDIKKVRAFMEVVKNARGDK